MPNCLVASILRDEWVRHKYMDDEKTELIFPYILI